MNTRVQDIKPSNIFMNSRGNIKVLCPFSIPAPIDPFLTPSPTHNYFSPEELEARKKGQMFNETSSDTSESYGIGLSLLSAGLLGSQYDIYDYSNNTLKEDLLRDRIRKF